MPGESSRNFVSLINLASAFTDGMLPEKENRSTCKPGGRALAPETRNDCVRASTLQPIVGSFSHLLARLRDARIKAAPGTKTRTAWF